MPDDKKKTVEFVPVKKTGPEPIKLVACTVCGALTEEIDSRIHAAFHVRRRDI